MILGSFDAVFFKREMLFCYLQSIISVIFIRILIKKNSFLMSALIAAIPVVSLATVQPVTQTGDGKRLDNRVIRGAIS